MSGKSNPELAAEYIKHLGRDGRTVFKEVHDARNPAEPLLCFLASDVRDGNGLNFGEFTDEVKKWLAANRILKSSRAAKNIAKVIWDGIEERRV
jgi:hypothetical protein